MPEKEFIERWVINNQKEVVDYIKEYLAELNKDKSKFNQKKIDEVGKLLEAVDLLEESDVDNYEIRQKHNLQRRRLLREIIENKYKSVVDKEEKEMIRQGLENYIW